MNNKIYDNGYKILGHANYVIEYLKENMENVYEKDSEEYKDAYNIIEDLKYYKHNEIVTINYDSGMGTYIEDSWRPDTDQLEYYKDLEGEENE